MALVTLFDLIVPLIFYYRSYPPPMVALMTWLKASKPTCFRFLKLSMAYTHTETCLGLAGKTMHPHIDSWSTSYTLPLGHSYQFTKLLDMTPQD